MCFDSHFFRYISTSEVETVSDNQDSLEDVLENTHNMHVHTHAHNTHT